MKDITTKIRSGATPSGGESAYLPQRQRYALIRSQNVFDRYFDETRLAFISDEQASSLSGAEVMPGDLLLNITGDGITFARSCLVPATVLPACVNQHVMIIRVDAQHCEPGYLLSYLTHPNVKPYIESFNAGGSRRAITKGHIESFEVPLPPLPTQRRIADILSALDDKIELNRQTNATLEAMAQAIFKEWFVDFNYPGATGELVDSELGLIPPGWRIMPLDEIADFLNGLALQKYPADSDSDYLPVLKIRELKSGITSSTDKASKTIPRQYIIRDGDLIFSWSGTLEVKFWVGGEAALNQHLFKVTSQQYPLWFCYFWILHHLREFRSIAADKATTMGHIKRGHLSEAMCLVPTQLEQINKVVEPIIEKLINNEKEMISLAQIRDTLLPKLMCGEIAV